MEKDLRAIRVVIDVEPAKDSKYTSRRSQAAMSKVKENEASEIETLIRFLKSLTTEVGEHKKWRTETTMRNKPPKFAKRENVTLGSNGSHLAKFAQSSNVVLQMDQIMKDNFCMIHEERNLDKSFPKWNRVMGTMNSSLNDHFKASEQVKPEVEDEAEDVASDEAPSFGNIVSMYQCLHASHKKTTIKKKTPKKNNQYNLRSEGAPAMIEILN